MSPTSTTFASSLNDLKKPLYVYYSHHTPPTFKFDAEVASGMVVEVTVGEEQVTVTVDTMESDVPLHQIIPGATSG